MNASTSQERLPRSATLLRMLLLPAVIAGCTAASDPPAEDLPHRPRDTPALHHVLLNSVDPDAAIEWYLELWSSAERTEVADLPAVASEMYLLFNRVDVPAPGAYLPELGRPEAQSPFWHIGAFANTTDMDVELAAIGVSHLPLYTGPDDDRGVWRSGLTPYTGTRTAEQLSDAEPALPRPGGFSYVLAPDGVLFELTGGANTTASMSHVHFFHEHPQCAANWYVEHLGMSLPPIRHDDGSTSERPRIEPCEADLGRAGWPSLESVGTIRQPRGTVVHGNGSMSFYTRQCTLGRCGDDRPLVPSRGQVLDHVGFTVADVDAWYRWLDGAGVVVLEAPHAFGESRAFMIEGPDGLAIELVASSGAPATREASAR